MTLEKKLFEWDPVVFTERGSRERIISARKATKEERGAYYEHCKIYVKKG